MKCENKKNIATRTNLKSPVSEHRNSSPKKEQKVCLLICSKLTILITYIYKVEDENKDVKFG